MVVIHQCCWVLKSWQQQWYGCLPSPREACLLTSAHLAYAGKQTSTVGLSWEFLWLVWAYLDLLSKTYILLCRFCSSFLFLPLYPFLFLVEILRTCLRHLCLVPSKTISYMKKFNFILEFCWVLCERESHLGFQPMSVGLISPPCLINFLSVESQSIKSSQLSLRI